MRIQRVDFYNKNTFTAQSKTKKPQEVKPFTAEDLAAKMFKKYRNISKNDTIENFTNYIKNLNLSQNKLNEFAIVLRNFPKVNIGTGYNFQKFLELKDNTFNEQNSKIILNKLKYFPKMDALNLEMLLALEKIDDKYIHQVSEIDGEKGYNGYCVASSYNYKFKNTDKSIELMPDCKLKNELQEINQKLKNIVPTHHTQNNPILLGHIAFDDNIDDPILKRKIKQNLIEFKQAEWTPWEKVMSMSSNEPLYNKQIQEIMIIQDVVNSYKNIYNPMKRVYPSHEDEHIRNEYPYKEALEKLAKKIAKEQKISEKEALKKIHKEIGRGSSQFAKDAQQAIKNAPLQDYIEIFGEKDPKTAKHLYNQYYLTQYPEHIQTKCKQIAQKFGTFVFLPTDFEKADLDFINQELSLWKKAGKKEAVMPRCIAFSPIKKTFIRSKAAACANNPIKIIYVRNPKYLRYALRHEMMHINDEKITKKFKDFDYYKDKGIRKQIRKKQWFRNEFVKAEVPAGKKDWLIDYAYMTKNEYLAVAAEGDMKKYSEQFKQVLESLGMKRWIMRLPFVR